LAANGGEWRPRRRSAVSADTVAKDQAGAPITMCGRYAITTSRFPRLENGHGVALPAVRPRYNVAPTQVVPIVRATEAGSYELAEARWGLIPAWSKEPRTAFATFNARVENADASRVLLNKAA
jgi:putative SOS response-associated peptidase YedK